jgi:hypothetical protein
VAGRSELVPEARDWRFKDETWQTYPGYRRLMQVYLAWSFGVRWQTLTSTGETATGPSSSLSC